MNIIEVRRQNLLGYIRDTYAGNRAEFCRATGKNPNLINLVLTNNPEYRRNIGEKLARDIEERTGLASGWLDSPRGIGARKVAKIPILVDSTDVPDKAPLEADYYVVLPVDDPTLALRSTGLKNLVIVTAQESGMTPTFTVGSNVWVDLGIKKPQGDGVYVLRVSGATQFRRIQQMPNGDLRVSQDDPAYAPQILKSKASSALKVVGKAIAVTTRITL